MKDRIQKRLQSIAKNFEHVKLVDNGLKGALIGHLNDACGGDDERHRLLQILFGKSSSKELTDGEWAALHAWISPTMIGDGWVVGADFLVDVHQLLREDNEHGKTERYYTFD